MKLKFKRKIRSFDMVKSCKNSWNLRYINIIMHENKKSHSDDFRLIKIRICLFKEVSYYELRNNIILKFLKGYLSITNNNVHFRNNSQMFNYVLKCEPHVKNLLVSSKLIS